MCAEMAADLEPCYAMLWQAAHSFDHDPDEARLQACKQNHILLRWQKWFLKKQQKSMEAWDLQIS